MEKNKIYQGNCIEVMKTFPDNSIDCCITSPPYWGLRDYGTATWIGGDEKCMHQGKSMRTRENINRNTGTGIDKKNSECKQFFRETCEKCGAVRQDEQIGLEKTPEEFVDKMVMVFSEVKRILKPCGTLWLNLGDSYNGYPGNAGNPQTLDGKQHEKYIKRPTGYGLADVNLKPKDLVGIPWMVAFALRANGWYLRSDIIWSKPNPMPESVADRPTKSHEYIFLFSKSQKYFYDAHAIKTPTQGSEHDKHARVAKKRFPTDKVSGIRKEGYYPMANKRSVWTVTTQPYKEAHFATFPEELIEPCVLAGTSEEGNCISCGSPYERIIDSEKGFESGSGKSGNEINGKNGHHMQGGGTTGDVRKGPVISTRTLGWQPTCKCIGGGGRTRCYPRSVFRGRHHIHRSQQKRPKFYWNRIKRKIYFTERKKTISGTRSI